MKSYLELHHESGIKVGDIVKVTRKAKSYELGWDEVWVPEMDLLVGKVFTVEIDEEERGFAIHAGENYYALPCFVLENLSQPATNERCINYDEDYMDSLSRGFRVEPTAEDIRSWHQATVTYNFDLSSSEGKRLADIYAQAELLHSFAFDVVYNLVREFERWWDADPGDVEDGPDKLRELINDLVEGHKINV